MKSLQFTAIQDQMIRSILIVNWVGVISLNLLGWLILGQETKIITLFVMSLCMAGFNHYLLKCYLTKKYISKLFIYPGIFASILIVAGLSLLFTPYEIGVELVFLLIICITGLLAGRKAASLALVLIVFLSILSLFIAPHVTEPPSHAMIHLFVLIIAGFWTSQISGYLQESLESATRKNHYLSLLLRIDQITSKREDLQVIFPEICRAITSELPASSCVVLLCDTECQNLTLLGASPLGSLALWGASLGDQLAIQPSRQIFKVLDSGNHLILHEPELSHPDSALLADHLAFEGAKSLGIFPLICRKKILGMIAIAENRNWQREPFSEEKIQLLTTLASQIGSAIENSLLVEQAHKRAQQLSVLFEVGKAIGSTIEMEDLLELIYDQLIKVIAAESYFVSLYNDIEDLHEVQILIDDGKRYPPQKVDLRRGLASWVIQSRKPLLIRHLSQEKDDLPVQPILLGEDRMSESWLGVPMLAGDRVLGFLAVASYKPFAFAEDDLELMASIAAQAALALDNAFHHANVKEQARKDSLTEALNHGAFLKSLDQAIANINRDTENISLIMLDIDHFKEYNDRYGHRMGDEVLIHLVREIRSVIPEDSLLGRWGGEEFVIAMVNMPLGKAEITARKIQHAVNQIEITSENGNSLPVPTVSQGIAIYPNHASNMFQLIDEADFALYQAKNNGRNQIKVAPLRN